MNAAAPLEQLERPPLRFGVRLRLSVAERLQLLWLAAVYRRAQ